MARTSHAPRATKPTTEPSSSATNIDSPSSSARVHPAMRRGGVEAGEALCPEDVPVGGLPRANVHGRDLGGVGDRRPADLHYLPAEEETKVATDWICASVSFPLNAGITAPPFVT